MCQLKKQVRFAQTSVFSTELYGMNNAWRERSKEKKIETERERIGNIREGETELWFPWMN